MPITPELFCENCFPLIEPVVPENAPTELNRSLLVLGNNNPTFVQVVDLNTTAIVDAINKAAVVDPVEIGCVWGVNTVFTSAGATGSPSFLIIGGTYNAPTRVVERATMVGSDPAYADATVLTTVAEGMIIGSGGPGFRIGTGVALRFFRQGGTMLLQRQTGSISPSNTQIDYVGPWATIAEWTYRLYDTYSFRVYAQNTFGGDPPNELGRVFARLEAGRNGVGVYNENFTIVAPVGEWTSQAPFGGAYVQEGLWTLETLNPLRVTNPDHRFAMYMMEGVAVPDEVPSGGSYKPHPEFGTSFESCANPTSVPEFTSTYDPPESVPATITFTDITPGATTSTWDFGDGSAPVTAPAGIGVVHIFTQGICQDVTLTNESGSTSQQLCFTDPGPVIPLPGIDLPMEQLTAEQYGQIAVKHTTATFPLKFYDDEGYPSRTLTFWPIPKENYLAMLWLWQPLISVDDLDTDMVFPNGYERALRFALAQELAAEFGKEVPQGVRAIAALSKSNIKRLNSVPQIMRGSLEIASNRQKLFNYIIGDTIGSTGIL
jgi:hypothetical protein